MCLPTDSSFEGNLIAQNEMLRKKIVTLDQMPKLVADATRVEKIYINLMKQSGWTPEQLFVITGYRILDNSQ